MPRKSHSQIVKQVRIQKPKGTRTTPESYVQPFGMAPKCYTWPK